MRYWCNLLENSFLGRCNTVFTLFYTIFKKNCLRKNSKLPVFEVLPILKRPQHNLTIFGKCFYVCMCRKKTLQQVLLKNLRTEFREILHLVISWHKFVFIIFFFGGEGVNFWKVILLYNILRNFWKSQIMPYIAWNHKKLYIQGTRHSL